MQSEHKIQSGKGSLHIEMDQVPKILKPLVSEWTREGYIVSFKVGSLFRNLPSLCAGTRVRRRHNGGIIPRTDHLSSLSL